MFRIDEVMTIKSFGTAINCIDGRVQEPVSTWLKEKYQLGYVDVITEAGPDAILADGASDVIRRIREKVAFSIQKHGSRLIAVVAHHDCAGNPVSRLEHEDQLVKSVEVISGWEFNVALIALWVNDDWKVKSIIEV